MKVSMKTLGFAALLALFGASLVGCGSDEKTAPDASAVEAAAEEAGAGNIVETAEDMVDEAVDAAGEMVDDAVDAAGEMAKDAEGMVKDAMDDTKASAEDAVDSAEAEANEKAADAVSDFLNQ